MKNRIRPTRTLEPVKVHCTECGLEREHPQDAREKLMMVLFGLCNKCAGKWKSIEPAEQELYPEEEERLEDLEIRKSRSDMDILAKLEEMMKGAN